MITRLITSSFGTHAGTAAELVHTVRSFTWVRLFPTHVVREMIFDIALKHDFEFGTMAPKTRLDWLSIKREST